MLDGRAGAGDEVLGGCQADAERLEASAAARDLGVLGAAKVPGPLANYSEVPHSRLIITPEELDHARANGDLHVASALAGHRLHLHAWVYKLETGEVFHFDSDTNEFTPIQYGQLMPRLAHGIGAERRPAA